VMDPSGRFTGETAAIRDGLVSSVDVLRMLVSLGHNGAQKWLTGDLWELYGKRLNIVPMLKSAAEPGRGYVLLATDEVFPQYENFNDSPTHVIGVQTKAGKLGTYAHWVPATDEIMQYSAETELYDYSTERGREELDNIADSHTVEPAVSVLFDSIVPNELRAPMPAKLREPVKKAKEAYLRYEGQNRREVASAAPTALPYGGCF
jgi:hypothetical protein